jgi:hypothetical protein
VTTPAGISFSTFLSPTVFSPVPIFSPQQQFLIDTMADIQTRSVQTKKRQRGEYMEQQEHTAVMLLDHQNQTAVGLKGRRVIDRQWKTRTRPLKSSTY